MELRDDDSYEVEICGMRMVHMDSIIEYMGMLFVNQLYILTNLNNAKLFKSGMTVTGNSNLSHLVTQDSRKILSLPVVIVHH